MHPELQACLQGALVRLLTTTQRATDRALESLGHDAMRAGSNAERQGLMAAQFELGRKLTTFKATFASTFKQKVEEDVRPRDDQAAPATDWSALSLVDDRTDEARVSADRLAQVLGSLCDAELRELSGYTATLLGQPTINAQANPLRPDLLAKALFRGIEAVTADPMPRRQLARHLALSLAQDLPGCYTQIAAEFRRRGIEPLGFAATRAAEGATVHAAGEPAPAATAPIRSGGAPSGGEAALWGALQGMLGIARPVVLPAAAPGAGAPAAGWAPAAGGGSGGPGGMAGESGGSNGGAAPVPAVSLAEAIEHLARRIDGLGVGPGAAQPLKAYREELEQAAATPVDRAILDGVAALFDEILRDPQVPPALARQLARLQMPTLRIALADPAFFQSSTQITRRIIDRLGALALGYESLDSPEGRQFMAGVEKAIDAFLADDFAAVDAHDRLLDCIEDERDRLGQDTQAGAREALMVRKETELRLQFLQGEALRDAVAALNLPAFLTAFILEHWPRAQARVAIAHGVDSPPYKNLQHCLQHLVDSVQPKASPALRAEFLRGLPQLMKDIQALLADLGWSPGEQDTFLGQLRPAHLEALKQPALGTAELLRHRNHTAHLQAQLVLAAEAAAASLAGHKATALPVNLTPRLNAGEAAQLGLVTGLPTAGVELDTSPAVLASVFGAATAPGTELSLSFGKADAAVSPQEWLTGLVEGEALRVRLERGWEQVRITGISPGRAFFVFKAGPDGRVFTLTAGMLARLRDLKRAELVETAGLVERASKRVREANWF